jgi:hypothetical protein
LAGLAGKVGDGEGKEREGNWMEDLSQTESGVVEEQ